MSRQAGLVGTGCSAAAIAAGAALMVSLGAGSPVPWLVLGLGLVISALAGWTAQATERHWRDRNLGLLQAQRLARVGSWAWNSRTKRVYWSEEMYDLFGRERRLGPPGRDEFHAYLHAEDRQSWTELYQQMESTGDLIRAEFRIIRPDGQERVLHTHSGPDRHRPHRYFGVMQDVTELRAAERQLLASEQRLRHDEARLRAVIDNVPAIVALRGLDGRYELVNKALGEFLGVAPEEMIGRSALHHHLPDTAERVAADDAQIRAEGRPVIREVDIPQADGGTRTYYTVRYPIVDSHGELTGFGSVALDITDRKRAEDALRFREQQLAEAQRAARLGSWEIDLTTNCVTCSEELCTIFGLDPGTSFTSRDFLARVHPDDLERVRVELGLAGKALSAESEHRIIRASDGEIRHVQARSFARTDAEGKLIKFWGTTQDLTDRVHYEEELERERRALNEAQVLARVGSWDYDLVKNEPGHWSTELWRMLGLLPRPQAPANREFLRMVHPEDRERVVEALRRIRDNHEPWEGEFRMITADRREICVAFRAYQTYDVHGQPRTVFGTLQDITERAQREREDRAVHELAQIVAQGARPTAVFDHVSRQTLALFHSHTGSVIRFDRQRQRGVFVNGLTREGRQISGTSLDLSGDSAPGRVFRTGESARVESSVFSAGAPDLRAIVGPIDDAVAAPIIVAGQLWGCLGIAFSDGPAPPDTERRLERFAELVAMAVANAETRAVLARQAATDAVTGLANRRSFSARLREEAARARRYGHPLSLVLFDLDHFKDVNDTHGHQAGDRVLAEFGRRLRKQARHGELVARIGGEEFAWLMPEAGADGAVQAAERVRCGLEEEAFSGVGVVTVSAGVCCSDEGLEGDALVRLADQALYRAKAGGRNATVLYHEDLDSGVLRQSSPIDRGNMMAGVRALARAIDSKDLHTREHSERVADLAEEVALELGWSQERAYLLRASGLLHDVGKIGIPDEVLLKPGPLSPEEYELVKSHAELGGQIAAEVLDEEQVSWIRGHHERWDGSGYPAGLAADQIPCGAQLLAIVDAYDVMTVARSYRRRTPVPDALTECRAQAGLQFAPAAVEALVAVLGRRASH